MAKNGVELLVRARVTVRTNLAQLIGGATEETIIARVGEGIITSIGSAQDHLQVMENPDRISKAVLERGLDAHTAFEIVSIDIADIDVGENIGARLQADQAEADTRKAQALAETRRADAIAREQEMKAAGGAQPGPGVPGRGGSAAGDGRGVPQRKSRAAHAEWPRVGQGVPLLVAHEIAFDRRSALLAVKTLSTIRRKQCSRELRSAKGDREQWHTILQPAASHRPMAMNSAAKIASTTRCLIADPRSAVVAAAAEHQPAEDRSVVVPAEIMIALRAARPREDDPLVRAESVPDDIQETADATAQTAEPDDREPPHRGGEAVVERVGGDGEESERVSHLRKSSYR